LETLPLAGYRGSRPVTLGNAARDQLQLGNYGDVFDMTLAFVRDGGSLQPQAGQALADIADHLCGVWRQPDASIWELEDDAQYTQGKLASWLAFTHAAELADAGEVAGAHAARWRGEAAAVERYVRERCWSERRGAYARAAGSDELDAAVLLATRGSFMEAEPERLGATVDAIRSELGAGGPLVYRFSGAAQDEGAFLACSFWVVEALAQVGRGDEAAEMMDALVALANDVGLYSEEIDPATGEFLGNLPQALSHLALINAAVRLGGG
jgi:GH15 family glucan-1,4-alpha-glucosidase